MGLAGLVNAELPLLASQSSRKEIFTAISKTHLLLNISPPIQMERGCGNQLLPECLEGIQGSACTCCLTHTRSHTHTRTHLITCAYTHKLSPINRHPCSKSQSLYHMQTLAHIYPSARTITLPYVYNKHPIVRAHACGHTATCAQLPASQS